MEMEAIEGLVLGELLELEKAHWNLEAFPKMPNLKLLIIHHVQLLHGPKHLSNNLRFLDWSEYPSKSLPSNFQPVELVELHLLYSKIEWLWKGTKYLDKLKLIKLNNSLNLIATPDFTGVPNLEKLNDMISYALRMLLTAAHEKIYKRSLKFLTKGPSGEGSSNDGHTERGFKNHS
ncbi:hypothetical protein CMV_027564 [Castanea mollissima]|uniref:Disease resistance protein n=1 Tax=Castanea mollissima TaxID=60419 RepID=A0A8J4V990_9ROSI|nr:hypothetical protein CMV_027564 [Castanea mollissima]